MIPVIIPGYRKLTLEHLVLDYNGTLACDGNLLIGVRRCLAELSKELRLHVITADTFGNARSGLKDVACEVVVLEATQTGESKRSYVQKLGREVTACVGNGRNDCAMMEVAALAIAVMGKEGAAAETIAAAHIVAPDIVSALDLLLRPQRLIATLRR